jgi:hypothetical protein
MAKQRYGLEDSNTPYEDRTRKELGLLLMLIILRRL